MAEAPLADQGSGLGPTSEGWFVVNLGDAQWLRSERFGAACRFETPDCEFPQLGFNVRVLQPGQAACLYHRENLQEAFLVLSGECVAVVEDQERRLRAWDFLHCPPDVDHVLIGAGEGPCVIVMPGARSAAEQLMYPVSEPAARYGASAETPTASPKEAYAPFSPPHPARPEGWEGLPWSADQAG